VASLSLLVVWIGSARWCVSWAAKNGYSIRCWAGWIGVTFHPPTGVLYSGPGWHAYGPGLEPAENDVPFRWWFYKWGDSREWGFYTPLWLPMTVFMFLGGSAWRLDALSCRGAQGTLCSKCQYDRAGLVPLAVCPECGAAASSDSTPTSLPPQTSA